MGQDQGRYLITLSKQARKDYESYSPSERKKIAGMITAMESDPFCPPCEKLVLNLTSKYSKRINRKDRLVFEIRHVEGYRGEVYILRLRTHYKNVNSLLML